MKLFLIYILCLFSTCSLFADRGAKFRDAVYNVDLTQPLGSQLEQDVFKKFEKLENPYSYFTELAVLPIDLKNHNPRSFGKTLSQEHLLEQYGHLIFNEAPQTLVLKSGGQCVCNFEDNIFYVHLSINKRKTINISAAVIPLFKPVKACIETDDGMLVILYAGREIEVFELFNRKMFTNLLLEQLIVLVNLYEISESDSKDVANSKKSVLINSDWYEIFKKIPENVIKYMFRDSIHVSTHERPENFNYVMYVDPSAELEPHIKALQSVFNQDKSNSLAIEPKNKQISSDEREEEEGIAILELLAETAFVNKRKQGARTTRKPKSQQVASKNLGINIPRLPQIIDD